MARRRKNGRKGEKAAILLPGSNPQIAKADGNAPVQAYIAAMPGWTLKRTSVTLCALANEQKLNIDRF